MKMGVTVNGTQQVPRGAGWAFTLRGPEAQEEEGPGATARESCETLLSSSPMPALSGPSLGQNAGEPFSGMIIGNDSLFPSSELSRALLKDSA